jgi:hypothetical protein
MENEAKPRAVTSAIVLLWAVLASGFLTFATGFDNFQMAEVVDNVGPYIVYMLAFVIYVVDFILILNISVGRNWARMTKLVLCILGGGPLFTISSIRDTLVASPSIPMILILIPAVQGVISVVAVCLLYSGSANRWFDQGESRKPERK